MRRSNPNSQIKVQGYTALPLMETSDHRPVACSFLVPAKACPEPGDEEESDEDVRIVPPYRLDPQWEQKREWARTKEVVVGVIFYATSTWEGRGMLLFFVLSVVGALVTARILLEV